MKRIDYIRSMSVEEMSKAIIDHNITDAFCDSSCKCENGCPRDIECCERWLNKEIGGDALWSYR
jgi:hypothetical protein